MKKFLIIGLIILTLILIYSLIFSGKQCGGFVGNIKTCPIGYKCVLLSRYPDGMGNCRFSPMFIFVELLNKYFK